MELSRLVFFSAAPLLALAVVAPAEEGKIYECTDTRGQIVYQGEPCLEGQPKLPPAPKPQRTAPKAQPAAPKSAAHRVSPQPPSPQPSPGPVDARWGTPEKTLRTFVGALQADDRALVLACLTAAAKADLGPDASVIPLEKLKELVASFTGYVVEGDLGPFWSIRAKRSGQRPKWILFERTGTGEWKIASI